MRLKTLQNYLRMVKPKYVQIHANIGRWELPSGTQWAIWNDDVFASGATVRDAASVFIFRLLSKRESLFPQNSPPIEGLVTFTFRNDDVLVEVKFFSPT